MDIVGGQPQIFGFHIISQGIHVGFILKFSGTSFTIYHLHLTISTLEVGFVSESSSPLTPLQIPTIVLLL